MEISKTHETDRFTPFFVASEELHTEEEIKQYQEEAVERIISGAATWMHRNLHADQGRVVDFFRDSIHLGYILDEFDVPFYDVYAISESLEPILILGNVMSLDEAVRITESLTPEQSSDWSRQQQEITEFEAQDSGDEANHGEEQREIEIQQGIEVYQRQIAERERKAAERSGVYRRHTEEM